MNLQDIPKLAINLESRPDRLTLLKKEVEGWNVYIMPGVVHKDPMIGIAQAHISCVRHAKEKQWPYVIIMEDDVQFRKGGLKYLNNALAVVPEDWNILMGGVYEENGVSSVNEYWDRIGEFCGLHFYIVNQNAYDRILQYDGKLHIDRWMNYNGKRFNAYITKKYMAIQRDGYSDNIKANTNYNSLTLNKRKLL